MAGNARPTNVRFRVPVRAPVPTRRPAPRRRDATGVRTRPSWRRSSTRRRTRPHERATRRLRAYEMPHARYDVGLPRPACFARWWPALGANSRHARANATAGRPGAPARTPGHSHAGAAAYDAMGRARSLADAPAAGMPAISRPRCDRPRDWPKTCSAFPADPAARHNETAPTRSARVAGVADSVRTTLRAAPAAGRNAHSNGYCAAIRPDNRHTDPTPPCRARRTTGSVMAAASPRHGMLATTMTSSPQPADDHRVALSAFAALTRQVIPGQP